VNRPLVPPLPAVPSDLRWRQRVLDASTWSSAAGALGLIGAFWGPVELRGAATLLLVAMAAATTVHAVARPALVRWANPARELDLPDPVPALLAGTTVSSVAVATGIVGDGGEESDDVRLRVGPRVLVAPAVAELEPRRLAALVLTAPQADRGSIAPAVLFAAIAVLAARVELWPGVATAAAVSLGFVVLGAWHHRRGRPPDDTVLERAGVDAVLFAFLLQGWTSATRSARHDLDDAAELWRQWIDAARRSTDQTAGLSPGDVDAELARLPRLEH
jgi:hypothetical protein